MVASTVWTAASTCYSKGPSDGLVMFVGADVPAGAGGSGLVVDIEGEREVGVGG